MSGLFGDNNQTVTSETKLPPWIEDFAKSTLSQASTVANELTPPYQGDRVADINGGQQEALAAAGSMIGRTDPSFQTAMGGASGVMGYNPQQVQSQSFLQGDIGAYMSPYTQQVEQQAMRQLDDQRLRSLNQTADNATAAGAFGGSRHGVMEGVVNAETAKQAGLMSAQLRDQAYRQGLTAMESDFGRNMQAQGMNQQAGLQGAGLNLQGAAAMGDLPNLGQDAYLKGIGAAQGAGNFLQSMDQLNLDTDQQRYNELRGYPLEQLDIQLNALGMTPYGSSSSQTTPMSGNPIMGGIGGALSGAQLGSMIMPGIGTGIGAAAGGLLGAFGSSDEREKTNKNKLGEVDGVDVYAYDYKDDVERAKKSGQPMGPKRVGPMAQDLERLGKGRVAEVGGKKIINLGFGMGGGKYV